MANARSQYLASIIAALVAGVIFLSIGDPAQAVDQHSIEVLIKTLRSPIPPAAVKEAQNFDDQLMTQGQIQGAKVYLVTDERSQRVYAMVTGLLQAMGEDTQHWVVRILDTDPPTVNAFVAGGKYVYVYTGLLDQATSNDELGFVLSHELGHSLLQHRIRAKEDPTSTVAGIAVLGALLSNKNRQGFLDFAKGMTASYSRVDEEEADAIAVAIARRAGYDPLRGADFFSRAKREADKAEDGEQRELQKARQEVLQAQANCEQATKWYRSSIFNQTPGNTKKVNATCQDAENRRVAYNQRLERFNQYQQQKSVGSIYRSHPAEQNRVAAIAALNDYVQKRRELESIQKYQQSYRVMVALREVKSVLLKPSEKLNATPAPPAEAPAPAKTASGSSLSEQLADLKRAKDEGLLTNAEYEQKRQQILKRF